MSNYSKEIGTYLANLLSEMVLAEEGVTGLNMDVVKNMDEFGKAKPLYQQKAIKAYQSSFDKHEHEGQSSAHDHAMAAAREVFVRAKKNAKAGANRRWRDDTMRSMGMNKVKGAVSGRTYWESAELSVEEKTFLTEEPIDRNHPSFKAGEKAYNNAFRKTATSVRQERHNNANFATTKERHLSGIGNLPDKLEAGRHFTAGYDTAHAKHSYDYLSASGHIKK